MTRVERRFGSRRAATSGEAPLRKWPMKDVSFLADFPKLRREIGHEAEAVFG